VVIEGWQAGFNLQWSLLALLLWGINQPCVDDVAAEFSKMGHDP
jgi:hypothetical protein